MLPLSFSFLLINSSLDPGCNKSITSSSALYPGLFIIAVSIFGTIIFLISPFLLIMTQLSPATKSNSSELSTSILDNLGLLGCVLH